MWPFTKKIKHYVNNHPCDKIKHAFEWFGGIIVVMQSGDAYIIKQNLMTNDYEITTTRTIRGEHF